MTVASGRPIAWLPDGSVGHRRRADNRPGGSELDVRRGDGFSAPRRGQSDRRYSLHGLGWSDRAAVHTG